MPHPTDLLAGLPPIQRLATAYAPRRAKGATLALLALDTRLAGIVRSAREPMLAQLRLAWWRERLGEPAGSARVGEPLLALLRVWEGQAGALSGLVHGWEHLTGEAPLPADAFSGLAAARGEAFAALAVLLGEGDAAAMARRFGHDWALADLASHVAHAQERETLHALVAERDWSGASLPRSLRPLAILRGLGARDVVRGEQASRHGAGALVAAIRIGLAGR